MVLAPNFAFAELSDEALLNLCNCKKASRLSYLSNLNFQSNVAGDIFDNPLSTVKISPRMTTLAQKLLKY